MTDKKPQIQEQIDEFRRDFYSGGEWALDISEAKFSEFGCEGIDADLFVRDTATQFVAGFFTRLSSLARSLRRNFGWLRTSWKIL